MAKEFWLITVYTEEKPQRAVIDTSLAEYTLEYGNDQPLLFAVPIRESEFRELVNLI